MFDFIGAVLFYLYIFCRKLVELVKLQAQWEHVSLFPVTWRGLWLDVCCDNVIWSQNWVLKQICRKSVVVLKNCKLLWKSQCLPVFQFISVIKIVNFLEWLKMSSFQRRWCMCSCHTHMHKVLRSMGFDYKLYKMFPCFHSWKPSRRFQLVWSYGNAMGAK